MALDCREFRCLLGPGTVSPNTKQDSTVSASIWAAQSSISCLSLHAMIELLDHCSTVSILELPIGCCMWTTYCLDATYHRSPGSVYHDDHVGEDSSCLTFLLVFYLAHRLIISHSCLNYPSPSSILHCQWPSQEGSGEPQGLSIPEPRRCLDQRGSSLVMWSRSSAPLLRSIDLRSTKYDLSAALFS